MSGPGQNWTNRLILFALTTPLATIITCGVGKFIRRPLRTPRTWFHDPWSGYDNHPALLLTIGFIVPPWSSVLTDYGLYYIGTGFRAVCPASSIFLYICLGPCQSLMNPNFEKYLLDSLYVLLSFLICDVCVATPWSTEESWRWLPYIRDLLLLIYR